MSKHSRARAGENTLCVSVHSLWWGLSFWLWLQPVPAHGVALRALGVLEEMYFSIGSAETMAGESQRPLLVLAGQTLPCWDWTDAFEREVP